MLYRTPPSTAGTSRGQSGASTSFAVTPKRKLGVNKSIRVRGSLLLQFLIE